MVWGDVCTLPVGLLSLVLDLVRGFFPLSLSLPKFLPDRCNEPCSLA